MAEELIMTGHVFKTELDRAALLSLFDDHFNANDISFWRSTIGAGAFCAGVW
eukprot:COSAG06_NODE_43116_length_375_cov_0.619565_1_plen_51_part_01